MSLTHKALSAMGIEPEKIEQILDMHTETIESIKADKDKAVKDAEKYKADAEKLAETEKELAELQEISKKYEEIKADFEKYKGEQTEKETKASKTKAYRQLLKEAGISNERIDWALDHAKNVDAVEFDENKEVKNAEDIIESIKKDFDAFITTSGEQGAKTATPPKNGGSKMSKEDILKIEDDGERQRAIAENHEIFGF